MSTTFAFLRWCHLLVRTFCRSPHHVGNVCTCDQGHHWINHLNIHRFCNRPRWYVEVYYKLFFVHWGCILRGIYLDLGTTGIELNGVDLGTCRKSIWDKHLLLKHWRTFLRHNPYSTVIGYLEQNSRLHMLHRNHLRFLDNTQVGNHGIVISLVRLNIDRANILHTSLAPRYLDTLLADMRCNLTMDPYLSLHNLLGMHDMKSLVCQISQPNI